MCCFDIINNVLKPDKQYMKYAVLKQQNQQDTCQMFQMYSVNTLNVCVHVEYTNTQKVQLSVQLKLIILNHVHKSGQWLENHW